MANPAPRTNTFRDDQQGQQRENRAIDALLPTIRAFLPMVSEADARALLTAAQENDRTRFDTKMRAVAPNVNTEQVFNAAQTWFEWFTRGVTVTAEYASFVWAENRPEADRVGRGAREAADEGRRIGISNAPAIVLGQMRNAIETRGRELHRSSEQISTQQEDLARAAIGYGFSVSDVLNVFGDFAAPGANNMSRQRSDAFKQVLGEAASKRTEELMKRMRETQESMGGAEGARRRQLQEEYNNMLAEYGRLTGHTLASEVADRWVRGGEAPQAEQGGRQVTLSINDMKRAAMEETEHVFDLHNHRLGNVRISLVEAEA
jgi:hypothetical protein